MKNLTTIKISDWEPNVEQKEWIWPSSDVTSWPGQNESKYLYKSLLPFVKEKNIMIQAGGNCGFILSQFVPHFNTIYTFEPDPVNFYCLNQNVTSANVIKMQACLGNTRFPVNVQQLNRPNMPHDIGGVHINGSGFIPSIVIDDLNLPTCNLIQLDIEGYEFYALKGAVNTIQKYKPVLCIEFCENWLSRYETNSGMILNLLKELNYVLVGEHGVDKIFIYNKE